MKVSIPYGKGKVSKEEKNEKFIYRINSLWER